MSLPSNHHLSPRLFISPPSQISNLGVALNPPSTSSWQTELWEIYALLSISIAASLIKAPKIGLLNHFHSSSPPAPFYSTRIMLAEWSILRCKSLCWHGKIQIDPAKPYSTHPASSLVTTLTHPLFEPHRTTWSTKMPLRSHNFIFFSWWVNKFGRREEENIPSKLLFPLRFNVSITLL